LNKAIKVLHTEWSDGWGGQEIRIIEEMLAIRDHGIEVFLACRDHGIIKQKAIEHGIPTFTLAFNGNADIKTIFGLIKIIQNNSIDIVNTHSGKDTWVGGFAAKLSSVKFIRTRHLSNPINPRRSNFINEIADYIITTGESVKEDMIHLNRIKANRIQSIPTGIDSKVYNPALYDRAVCRQHFNLMEDEIAIGIVAIFRQFKRHDLFLEMAKSLVKKYPDKKLVFCLAGDGPKKDDILFLVKKLNLESKVRILGYVKKVPDLLQALDIFVLCSDSKEGVPQSVIQALLMNKNVVATNCGSTKDLLNEDNFQLINTKSLSNLIEAVSFFIEGNNSNYDRSFIVNNFSKSVMAKKVVKLYNLILK
jgi:glycosyltransferase involved in cell wall biosynthesis